MKDYSQYSIVEAANFELISDLVDLIKTLDSAVAKARLVGLINSFESSVTFADIAGRFCALADSKTCLDRK